MESQSGGFLGHQILLLFVIRQAVREHEEPREAYLAEIDNTGLNEESDKN